MLKKLSLLLGLSLALLLWAKNNTQIDYAITSGQKWLTPFESFPSTLPFQPMFSEIRSYYSDLEKKELTVEGKTVSIKFFSQGVLVHEFVDLDSTGRIEQWKEYKQGALYKESRIDEATGLIIDQTIFDTAGNIIEVRTDTTKKGFFSERSLYQNGKIIQTLRDLDGDSLFEEEINYNLGGKLESKAETLYKTQAPPLLKLYIAGFFRHSDQLSLDQELTQKTIAALEDFALNDLDATKNWFQKWKSKDQVFINRFELYNVIMPNADKSLDTYILSGDVYREEATIFISFHVFGPNPIQKITAGFLSYSVADYSPKKAAQKIYEKIKKTLQKQAIKISQVPEKTIELNVLDKKTKSKKKSKKKKRKKRSKKK